MGIFKPYNQAEQSNILNKNAKKSLKKYREDKSALIEHRQKEFAKKRDPRFGVVNPKTTGMNSESISPHQPKSFTGSNNNRNKTVKKENFNNRITYGTPTGPTYDSKPRTLTTSKSTGTKTYRTEARTEPKTSPRTQPKNLADNAMRMAQSLLKRPTKLK
jgi:hypothetical protein